MTSQGQHHSIRRSHDELVQTLIGLLAQTSKDKVARLFLASLSSHRLDWRAGLAAYASSCLFEDHSFVERYPERRCEEYAEYSPCALCGNRRSEEAFEPEMMQELYLESGGFCRHDLSALCYMLEYTLSLESPQPTPQDSELLRAILEVLSSADGKKRQVLTKLRKIPAFEADAEQCQYLLETLGYCGILRTPQHPAPSVAYRDMIFPPRRSHNSDWAYPMDFWEPAYGIDPQRVSYWFGAYL